MGTKHAKQRLFEGIEEENVEKVEAILQKFPHLLNQAFYEDGVLNCVCRAAWRGDKKMLKMLKDKGADMNLGGMKIY
jgi:hypothetical protein